MKSFINVPSAAKKQVWEQLCGASQSMTIADYCKNNPNMHIIITSDNVSATEKYQELDFLLKDTNYKVLLFPDWEILPFDHFSPHHDIVSQRLEALHVMQRTKLACIVVSISTLMHRIAPPDFISQHSMLLRINDVIILDDFIEKLSAAGYTRVDTVLSHGEYALRGSILDLYPMGSPLPYRIELFDNTVESLRTFDIDTQRTIAKILEINLLPAHEFSLSEQAISKFRSAFRTHFNVNPGQCNLYEAVSQSQAPQGIEYYLPLFFEKTTTLLEHGNVHTCFLIESVHEASLTFWQSIENRYQQLANDITRPILKPSEVCTTTSNIFEQINSTHVVQIQAEDTSKKGLKHQFNTSPITFYKNHSIKDDHLLLFSQYVKSNGNKKFIIFADSIGRMTLLEQKLSQLGIKITNHKSWDDLLENMHAVNLINAPFTHGSCFENSNIECIAENEIYGETKPPQRNKKTSKRNIDPDAVIRSLSELEIGQAVVHLDYGVGRYQGLQRLDNNPISPEFLVIHYAGSDKIYVPITSLHLISRYTGKDSTQAPLHRLGTEQWQKEKNKALDKIKDTAIELLDIYAKRAAQDGFSSEIEHSEYQRFADGFPFDETEDQTKAITEIIQDMQSKHPMDRLICGDVGFGKTEVAMRAAFLAVQNGKQVCVLVPTTLLAQQHYSSFSERFAEFAIQIELLSRFQTAKTSRNIVEWLKEGKVDIVIGTHKLFQKNIGFQKLGLLIIDEEHRFGVRQKEYIKALRTEVDILSMTATPIPRTLNMAMSGIRDISIISTPPAKRLAIKTFWQEKQDSIIKEAVSREILRGGQVFFVHNDVKTIARIAENLSKLVPSAKINFAHGQMRERELERIMSDFYHHRFNVLISTTIIETGIDIPTANTIIIDRADKFGLAQLHQLRGRVGRSHHQAYAYLLTPNRKLLSSDAIKRLEAIVSLEDLGAGFVLATHDLEIRGAGELLGDEQSGSMHAIGFELFAELLNKAVQELKSGNVLDLQNIMQKDIEVELPIQAIIPADYIADVHTRLVFYKRVANTTSESDLHELQVEMIDRFGLMPEYLKNLIALSQFKLFAKKLGVLKINASNKTKAAVIEFSKTAKINPEALITLIQSQPGKYKMASPTSLKVIVDNPDCNWLEVLSKVLKEIS